MGSCTNVHASSCPHLDFEGAVTSSAGPQHLDMSYPSFLCSQCCGHTGLSPCFHTESGISLSVKVSNSLPPPTALCTNTRRKLRELGWILILCLMALLRLLCPLCFLVRMTAVCLWRMHLCVAGSVFSCVCLCGCLDYRSPPCVLRQLTVWIPGSGDTNSG